MSVSSNRVLARRLVQEKLCNLLFNNQQKCVTLTSKRNLGSTVFPPSSQSSPFMRINQHNNKFGSFIKHSQVSLTFSSKLTNFDWTFLLHNKRSKKEKYLEGIVLITFLYGDNEHDKRRSSWGCVLILVCENPRGRPMRDDTNQWLRTETKKDLITI